MKPISKTAYFCCGARMEDAQSDNPVCGDMFAESFMDKEAMEVFDRFSPFKNAKISNATRHRIIDDLIREELNKNPQTTIIIIGSGFDTRAFRLGGGNWVEIDEQGVIEYKNTCLDVSTCKNPLRRIPCDFGTDSLGANLSAFKTGSPVIIIIEGVFIYLTEQQVLGLLETIQAQFPRHTLICDLQTASFFKKFNTKFQKVLQEFGASLNITSDTPEQKFLDHGYSIKQRISILDKTIEYAKLNFRQTLTKFALNTVFRKIKDGYSIYVFKFSKGTGQM
jgi:methyltransferase (TIGR00027 family)